MQVVLSEVGRSVDEGEDVGKKDGEVEFAAMLTTPDKPAVVTIGFFDGVVRSVTGVRFSVVGLPEIRKSS